MSCEIINYDFVYYSILKSLNDWYEENYRDDIFQCAKSNHISIFKELYDETKFKCVNVGKARTDFLQEIYDCLENKKIE